MAEHHVFVRPFPDTHRHKRGVTTRHTRRAFASAYCGGYSHKHSPRPHVAGVASPGPEGASKKENKSTLCHSTFSTALFVFFLLNISFPWHWQRHNNTSFMRSPREKKRKEKLRYLGTKAWYCVLQDSMRILSTCSTDMPARCHHEPLEEELNGSDRRQSAALVFWSTQVLPVLLEVFDQAFQEPVAAHGLHVAHQAALPPGSRHRHVHPPVIAQEPHLKRTKGRKVYSAVATENPERTIVFELLRT